jgi:hypothetical protein
MVIEAEIVAGDDIDVSLLLQPPVLFPKIFGDEEYLPGFYLCYALQVTQPSCMLQVGPAISSTLLLPSTTFRLCWLTRGSTILPPCFSTVNCTAWEAAWVRR